MLAFTFTTPGGVTYTGTQTEVGSLRVSAESPSYPLHNAFLTLGSDGSNPTATVQQGPDSHIVVAPAGAGEFLYDSAAVPG